MVKLLSPGPQVSGSPVSERLNSTFASLADPTRRAIIDRLAIGDCSVGELARPFDISAPAISKHLRVLERAGMLRQNKHGRIRRCQLNSQPIELASQWVDQYRRFWDQKLDALARYLAEAKSQEPQND